MTFLFPSSEGLTSFPDTLAPYLGAVFFETFLYGMYLVLYVTCTFILLRRNDRLHWIMLASASIMFALATADIGYTYFLVFNKLLGNGLNWRALYPKYIMYVSNNVLADGLLLYRCYVVWGYKKRIVIGPFLLFLIAAACGYTFEGALLPFFRDSWIYLALTFSLNLILTALTAGRIWWLARNAKLLLEEGVVRRYNISIAILLETGIVYCGYIAFDIAFRNHKAANAVLDAGLIQIVGIMPTLIIVQVGLGRAVQEDELLRSDLIESNLKRLRMSTGQDRTNELYSFHVEDMEARLSLRSGGRVYPHQTKICSVQEDIYSSPGVLYPPHSPVYSPGATSPRVLDLTFSDGAYTPPTRMHSLPVCVHPPPAGVCILPTDQYGTYPTVLSHHSPHSRHPEILEANTASYVHAAVHSRESSVSSSNDLLSPR
ncbi:hypothetical protein BDQ12DRAFT_222783 [Crucibulum laeve]|uniref:Uncharacterized protein n=1 Tax=Crucibulum laeve TaxID=68775 RepID=A0A5C3LVW1_9AGAR|nr:hypothetical protein BDQ12DRAFT_222783 [Crucibulum laeve]